MPILKEIQTEFIPLIGAPGHKGFNSGTATDGSRLVSCIVTPIQHPLGDPQFFIEKRPGFDEFDFITDAAGLIGTAVFISPSTGNRISAYKNTTTNIITIFWETESEGTITSNAAGTVLAFTETIIGSTTYWLFILERGTDRGGYFLAEDAITTTSYTGDITNTSAVVLNVEAGGAAVGTAGMYAGQPITGVGIPASTRILSVDSSTQITLTNAATATTVGVTLTKTHIAKIIDVDFPSSTVVGNFVELDGYVFVMTSDGKIYNSDLNSVTSWTATGFISTNMATDNGKGLARIKNQIAAFGTTSIEFFYNAGNAVGSPLGRSEQAFSNYGLISNATSTYMSPVTSIGNRVCFFGQEANDYYSSIYSIDSNLQITKLSTPIIDRLQLITSSTDFVVSILDSFSMFGFNFLLLNYGSTTTLSASWLYCFETQLWYESGFPWLFRVSGISDPQCVLFNTGPGAGAAEVLYLQASGSLYEDFDGIDPDDYAGYQMLVQTRPIDHNTTKRKFIHSVSLHGATKWSSGTHTVTLEYSDDDYTTWTNVGTFDLTKTNPILHNLGSYEGNRAYRLTQTAAEALKLESLEIKFSIANS